MALYKDYLSRDTHALVEFLFHEEGDAAPCPVWSSSAIQVLSAKPDTSARIIEVMAKKLVESEMNRILLDAAKAKKAISRKRQGLLIAQMPAVDQHCR